MSGFLYFIKIKRFNHSGPSGTPVPTGLGNAFLFWFSVYRQVPYIMFFHKRMFTVRLALWESSRRRRVRGYIHAKRVYIKAKPCISSRRQACISSRRSLVYHQSRRDCISSARRAVYHQSRRDCISSARRAVYHQSRRDCISSARRDCISSRRQACISSSRG